MRNLPLLLMRNPNLDTKSQKGYNVSWIGGPAINTGFRRICRYGHAFMRLKCDSQSIMLIIEDAEKQSVAKKPRRRFYFRCEKDNIVRLHLVNGDPTNIVFDLTWEDLVVQKRLGINGMQPGEERTVNIEVKQIWDSI